MIGLVILERRLEHRDAVRRERRAKDVTAQRVGVVVEGAAIDVRSARTELDEVASVRPRHHVVNAEVVLGGERVVLRRASGEVALHGYAGRFGRVDVMAKVVFPNHRNLVQQYRRERRVQVNLEVVFVVAIVEAGRRQRLPAHSLILAGPVFIAVLGIGGMVLAELVRDPRAELGIARRCRNIGIESDAVWIRCGRKDSTHHRIAVLFSAIQRHQETAPGCEEDRPGRVAFIYPALLERLRWRQRILRVQGRVAKHEIKLAMIFVGCGFGDDFHLSAAGPIILRRIWILVDANFLHGRCRHGRAVRFDSVDNQA